MPMCIYTYVYICIYKYMYLQSVYERSRSGVRNKISMRGAVLNWGSVSTTSGTQHRSPVFTGCVGAPFGKEPSKCASNRSQSPQHGLRGLRNLPNRELLSSLWEYLVIAPTLRPKVRKYDYFDLLRVLLSTGTPQLLLKTPQIQFNRDHKALHRCTWRILLSTR